MRSPKVLFLPLHKQFFLVRIAQDLHNNPFCDLWPMNARGVGNGNIGFIPYWGFGHLVCASTEKMDQFQILDNLKIWWEAGKGYKNGCFSPSVLWLS